MLWRMARGLVLRLERGALCQQVSLDMVKIGSIATFGIIALSMFALAPRGALCQQVSLDMVKIGSIATFGIIALSMFALAPPDFTLLRSRQTRNKYRRR
jgi:hypothetical protein